jgi:RNA polymerase sigma-70 factor (ECF subfamily)
MERDRLVSLVTAAQRGDAAAWSPLVEEFLSTVVGTAYGLCGDSDLAHDIAHETFAIAIDHVRDVREPAAFAGWLTAIARSVAARTLRPERSAVIHAEPFVDAPESEVIAADESARLRSAVESLPESQRLPIVLHYYAQLALADIATLCELPLSTVKQRMRVARARLREASNTMTDDTLSRLRPQANTSASAVIQLFCALRAGDRTRVAAMLDAAPALVDAREARTSADRAVYRLALNGGGTPLIRAIERGDDAMVDLLLTRGANPNGACTCAGGESPLWTAVVHRRTSQASMLLDRGADPNASAFGATTPLHVAAMRGYDELVDLLVARGADRSARDDSGRLPADCAPAATSSLQSPVGATWWTGIKAIDLWAPLPAAGVVRWTPDTGVGSTVLLAELSWRASGEGRRVVWAGFAPTPLDAGDFAHGLAELGVAECVHLGVAAHDASLNEQLDAFETAVDHAGDDAMLVVFEAEGRVADVERRLPELATRNATTIVVAPFDHQPPSPVGSPYAASVAFDCDRAGRGQWPAVGAAGSWSRVADAAIGSFAARARALIAAGGSRADALQSWLSQPFLCAEPFSANPGSVVVRSQFDVELEQLLRS